MLAKLNATQKGDAATAATADLARLGRNYQYIQVECGLIRTALDGLAEELTAPQRKLKQALEDAQELKFTVKPDGSVEYPRASFATLPAPAQQQPARFGDASFLTKAADPNQAKAQEIAARIGQALQEASEIDGRYARVLEKLKADPDLNKTDWSDIAQDAEGVRGANRCFSGAKIPKDKSPKENAEWWKSLSQAERDEYAVLYPASIGKMDGLPSDVRDEANRIVLAETRLKVERELREAEANPPQSAPRYNPITGLPIQGGGAWEKWECRKKELQGQIAGMNMIQKRFDATGAEGLPDAYLLGFDAEKLGRVIIANGNPDTAEHTAVYVPGTTARLSDSEKEMDKMAALWRESRGMPGNPSVSTITWIGYDAPQSAYPGHNGDLLPEAASTSYADKAAPGLSKFLSGVQTAQGGPEGSHTTVIGHSYGTTVVGDTSMKHGLGADDVIAVASPGMLVGHAKELDAPEGHVWSEAASFGKDQVAAGGKLVGLGGGSPSSPFFTDPVGHILASRVPSDRNFGANIMQTDSNDHGGYWKDDSVSLTNQAAVVTKNYGVVKRD